MDIKSAFLQGMKLVPEAGSDRILWKLKKCVCGLADASLYWYNKVKEILLSTGCKMSQFDPAVFYWQDEQFKVTGVLTCHVDDLLWADKTQNFSTVGIPRLKSTFHVERKELEISAMWGWILLLLMV